MNHNVTIDLARVSGDSKKLDLMFKCPLDMCLTTFMLEARFVDERGEIKQKIFDLSNSFNNDYGYPENTLKKKNWVVSLPLDSYWKGDIQPAVYIITLKAVGELEDAHSIFIVDGWDRGYWYEVENIAENQYKFTVHSLEKEHYVGAKVLVDNAYIEATMESNSSASYVFTADPLDVELTTKFEFYDLDDQNNEIFTRETQTLIYYIVEDEDHINERINPTVHHVIIPNQTITVESTAVASDVNNIYKNLIDQILNPGERCTTISDEAIRNYIILYAHMLALQLDEIDDAMVYFKMINNNFDRCGNFNRPPRRHISTCNCFKK